MFVWVWEVHFSLGGFSRGFLTLLVPSPGWCPLWGALGGGGGEEGGGAGMGPATGG